MASSLADPVSDLRQGRARPSAVSNREAKHQRVLTGAAHAALVFDGDGQAQGWAQYGDPDELAEVR